MPPAIVPKIQTLDLVFTVAPGVASGAVVSGFTVVVVFSSGRGIWDGGVVSPRTRNSPKRPLTSTIDLPALFDVAVKFTC